MYYEQGLTMAAVARHLNTSRSTVSRLLAYARETGIVTIMVEAPTDKQGTVSAEFNRFFGVRTHIVPTLDVDSPTTRLDAVASVAASRLAEFMEPNLTLGIAWGNTVSAIAARLKPAPKAGSVVVQLNGAANALDTGTVYSDSIISAFSRAFDAASIHFPVPAFFDYPETKQALMRERSIKRVMDAIDSCDVALFGVGAMDPAMPSHVYAGGFLSAMELFQATGDGVVGDVCTVLIREDGSTDMPLNARASGPDPNVLKKIPARVCVVASPAKAPALLGALRAGVITDLIVDSTTAKATLARHLDF